MPKRRRFETTGMGRGLTRAVGSNAGARARGWGREGRSTGASPAIFQEHTGIPTLAAVCEAVLPHLPASSHLERCLYGANTPIDLGLRTAANGEGCKSSAEKPERLFAFHQSRPLHGTRVYVSDPGDKLQSVQRGGRLGGQWGKDGRDLLKP